METNNQDLDQKASLTAPKAGAAPGDLSKLEPPASARPDLSAILTRLPSMPVRKQFEILKKLIPNRELYGYLVRGITHPSPVIQNTLLTFALLTAAQVDTNFANQLYAERPIDPQMIVGGEDLKKLSELLACLGKYDQAIKVVHLALRLESPGRQEISYICGILNNLHEYFGQEKTEPLWRLVLERFPNEFLAPPINYLRRIEKGAAPQQEGYTSEALKAIQRVLALADERAIQGDLAGACEALLKLVQENPSVARAATRFCERHKIPKTISKALLDVVREEPERPSTKRTDAFPQECSGRPLYLKGTTKTLREWMDVATGYFRQGKNHQGLDIWFAVFSEYPQTKSFLKTALVKLQHKIGQDAWLEALHVSKRCAANPNVAFLLISVAAAGIKKGDNVADRLFFALLGVNKAVDVRTPYSRALLTLGRSDEAIAVWNETPADSVLQSLMFTELALRGGVSETALRGIFDRGVTINPYACLAFAYRQMVMGGGPHVARCLLTKLVAAQHGSLSELDRGVIRLTLVHPGIGRMFKAEMLERYRAENKLERKEVEELFASVDLSSAPEITFQRDHEMEEFLNRVMPTLRTGGFFRELSERQPHLNPGRSTSRMARSVLMKPNRLTPNHTRPGQKRRESS
jgi:tetratricopeptide (TPR) repeat protein